MDVRIGVIHSPRELDLELPDDASADEVARLVETTVRSGDGAVLWFTDRKGRRIGVPADKVAWVEIGSGGERGRIGFGA